MQNTNAQAKTTSAAFGYGSQDIDGFRIYTVKIRCKRLDLLHLSMEHVMYVAPTATQGMRSYRVMDKKHRQYEHYVFVTTDKDSSDTMRKMVNLARATVHDVQSMRLTNGDYEYLPEYLHDARMRILVDDDYNSWGVYKEAFGNDDLPF